MLQEMGQGRVPGPLEAGQEWNAVLSIKPFSAWTIPGEAQGKSFAEEGWGRIEPLLLLAGGSISSLEEEEC